MLRFIQGAKRNLSENKCYTPIKLFTLLSYYLFKSILSKRESHLKDTKGLMVRYFNAMMTGDQ